MLTVQEMEVYECSAVEPGLQRDVSLSILQAPHPRLCRQTIPFGASRCGTGAAPTPTYMFYPGWSTGAGSGQRKLLVPLTLGSDEACNPDGKPRAFRAVDAISAGHRGSAGGFGKPRPPART